MGWSFLLLVLANNLVIKQYLVAILKHEQLLLVQFCVASAHKDKINLIHFQRIYYACKEAINKEMLEEGLVVTYSYCKEKVGLIRMYRLLKLDAETDVDVY